MRVGRLDFGRQATAEVALLRRNLEFWPEFLEVAASAPAVSLETRYAPIPVRAAVEIAHNRLKHGVSVGWAAFGARLRQSGAKVLFGTDQTREPFEMATRITPNVRQLLVAHGSLRHEGLALHNQIRHAPNRTLCVWGQHDADLYRRVIPNSVHCVVTGSLRNAMHIRINGLNPYRKPTIPLLFVSQYAGIRREGPPSSSNRNRVLRLLEGHLAKYCRENKLPIQIALRPPVSGTPEPSQFDDEVKHFRAVFEGVRTSFTDRAVRYSTYMASDAADVTVGVPSGSLTESFSRGNKVLMIRQSPETGTYLGFPYDGAWLLTEPHYEAFRDRLNYLRRIGRSPATEEWKSVRNQMVEGGTTAQAFGLIQKNLFGSLIAPSNY